LYFSLNNVNHVHLQALVVTQIEDNRKKYIFIRNQVDISHFST